MAGRTEQSEQWLAAANFDQRGANGTGHSDSDDDGHVADPQQQLHCLCLLLLLVARLPSPPLLLSRSPVSSCLMFGASV